MLKVLHIGEYVQGGVATYIKTLLSDDDKEIENHLLLAWEKSEHEWNLPTEQVHYYHNYRRSIGSVLKAMLKIRQSIKNIKPDVIYCHSTWAGVLARFPMLLIGKNSRVIYNAHGWAFLRDTAEWKRKIFAGVERLLTNVTDKIINVSKYEYNTAVKYGIDKEKMCVIYSGISANKKPITKKITMPSDRINLLFVGRFDPQKGIDWLLRVFPKCPRKDIHLYVIGDNVVSNGMGIEKKNTEKVTFLGWVNHDELPAYYEACDAVIMPSRWEAFGLVAIEAMKYGKPVIASNRGALPELISNDETGFIFKLDRTDSLLKLLTIVNKENMKDVQKKIKKVFFEKFTDYKMIKNTKKEYRDNKSND